MNSDKSQEEEIKDSLNFKLYITVYFFGTQLKELEVINQLILYIGSVNKSLFLGLIHQLIKIMLEIIELPLFN